jgi:hypothetical protein
VTDQKKLERWRRNVGIASRTPNVDSEGNQTR